MQGTTLALTAQNANKISERRKSDGGNGRESKATKYACGSLSDLAGTDEPECCIPNGIGTIRENDLRCRINRRENYVNQNYNGTDLDCGISGINVTDYGSGKKLGGRIRAPEHADATEWNRSRAESGTGAERIKLQVALTLANGPGRKETRAAAQHWRKRMQRRTWRKKGVMSRTECL